MLKLEKDQTLLSRFLLLQPLGEGGMGQVWLVRDLELQLKIAIKALHPHLAAMPGRIELLKNECRNTRNLAHPNIVRVFDFHRDEDLVFISMEYIEGQDLVAYGRNFNSQSYSEIIALLLPIVDALSYAHGMGLVHRDVKSSNILINRQQSPRLTDFGIAGVFKSGIEALDMTSGGSLYCMSPQQLEGRQPRPADDIYALGVLIYELLTGHPPFYPEITPDKIRNHTAPTVNQNLAQLQQPVAVPFLLDNLIGNMLAKAAAERPADMHEVARTLRKIHAESVSRTAPPAAPAHSPPADPVPPQNAQTITPLRVALEDKKSKATGQRRPHLLKALVLASAFILIISGGSVLLYILSRHPVAPEKAVETKHEPVTQSGKKPAEIFEEQPPQRPDSAILAQKKKATEQKLAEYIELTNELDRRGASQWGGQAYSQMDEIAKKADRLYMDQSYDAAVETYAQAIAQAGLLANQIDDALEQLLQTGHQALQEGNGTLAQEKFSVALMIDPGNDAARQGLQRAKTIETVMQLIATGQAHESKNKLSFAHTDYQQALELDPDSTAARKALARVKQKIIDQEFQQLISDGLNAYHNNDYQLARTKLLKAKAFKPDSREVQDALTQVDTAIRLSQIKQLKQKAAASEDSEDWARALELYLQILKLDPNVQFAVQGKKQTLQRIQITKRIHFFLDQPDILENDGQLQNAMRLVQEANEIEPRGPKQIGRAHV